MKKIQFFLPVILLVMSGGAAFSQKYKTAADTLKLNTEYVKVSNDIAELTSKLAVAQNNLPGYHTKAADANSEAQSTANESSRQATKATNGNLGDAKSAKKKANKALDKAEDSHDADNNVKDQDKKIAKLSSELQKKQEKLHELDEMRVAIRSLPQ
jgi:DNA repair exonuclease SbcCD ATPase subunit